jgi:uncharacterized membrane protein
MSQQWNFDPVGGPIWAAVLAIGLVVLVSLVGIPRDRLTPGRRLTLTGLRLLAAALAILALWRPSLIHTESRRQPATLVLLVDESRSMTVADAFGGKTRWQSLLATLTEALPALEELREQEIEVQLYTFDADTHAQEWKTGALGLADEPAGEQTAIGAALEDILRREAGKRLLGVILLSDGAQRAYAPRDLAPQNPARRLADLGFPLYTFVFGQARGLGQARDVAVKDLLVNPTVFVKNELAVQANVRIDGLVNQDVPVQLLFESPAGKMETVATKDLHSAKDGATLPVEMSTTAQTPGEFKLTVRAEKQPGEIVTTNNELSTFVTVLKGGLNVLYIEGALRVEQKFLRRSLDASADIKVDYIRLAEPDPRKPRSLDLKPYFARGKYDVYVIGDIDSDWFQPGELAALAGVVHQGAGLLMLGGLHTFAPGGYFDTPLADLLPILMNNLDRNKFGEPVLPQLHLPGPLRMVPSKRLGARHFVLQLASGDGNRAAWEKLPPLDGANKFDRLKPSAQVLAETPDGKPLLVAGESGGRVLASAIDSTWRWWLGGFEPEHKRFWRQVVLWLARKDEQTEGNVWIKLAQRRYAPGGRVEFGAGAKSPHGDVYDDAQFEAEVILPDGTKRPVHLARGSEEMTAVFADTQQAGDYTVVVSATRAGEDLGTAKARFLIYEQDLELDNAAADPSLLASLAKVSEQSGGRLLAPEELPELLDQIKQQPLERQVEREVKETPWDTWPFFVLFVSVLSADWFLRKKWGLV